MKEKTLAIHRARPIREKPIYYGRQYIDNEGIKAIAQDMIDIVKKTINYYRK